MIYHDNVYMDQLYILLHVINVILILLFYIVNQMNQNNFQYIKF